MRGPLKPVPTRRCLSAQHRGNIGRKAFKTSKGSTLKAQASTTYTLGMVAAPMS
eukprot:CAMPEP_0172674352 /NCGR_PEP_ID=MMETSP1074-20121228/12689_1 /TAXON_ID=2916 /ORGANISM="Ceratium fusus, Strain PA161109" /LENGTH=53 /DNA_ID=CAMNT_0013491751 /DNA_START=237 /DNA_END=398 /DNA_ORIENTATION=-